MEAKRKKDLKSLPEFSARRLRVAWLQKTAFLIKPIQAPYLSSAEQHFVKGFRKQLDQGKVPPFADSRRLNQLYNRVSERVG